MSRELIQYGTFSFGDAKVSISESFVYDGDERTLLGTQYEVTVSGWLSATTSDSLRVKILAMRAALSMNRQYLRIWDDELGVTILELDPNAVLGEAAVHDWGPQVRQLTISELVGLRSARYVWRFGAFRKDCWPSLQGVVGGVISLQRTYSFSIDVAGYATRSVSGTLKVTRQAAPADQYRSEVAPGLPTRFRRIQQQFAQSPDGRTLTFNVVDQEVYATLPQQIADGEATWSVKIADLGARVFYVLNGRFKGAPSTPKSTLFGALLALIQSRFPMNDPSLIFEEASVDDAVYDNEISFSVVASGVVASLTSQSQIFSSMFAGMSKPPPQSTGLAFLAGPYGDLPGTPHVSKAQQFYDACQSLLPEASYPPTSIEAGRDDGVNVPAAGGIDDVVDQSGASQEHLTTPYVEFTERIGYHFDYKLSRMDRKDDGGSSVAPKFAQSSGPSVIATQCGILRCYAQSAAQLPAIPDPVWPSGMMREAWVEPDVGEPVADGSVKLFCVRWRYVIEWPSYVSASAPGDAFVAFPTEPRLGPGGTSQGTMAGKAPWLTGPTA